MGAFNKTHKWKSLPLTRPEEPPPLISHQLSTNPLLRPINYPLYIQLLTCRGKPETSWCVPTAPFEDSWGSGLQSGFGKF